MTERKIHREGAVEKKSPEKRRQVDEWLDEAERDADDGDSSRGYPAALENTLRNAERVAASIGYDIADRVKAIERKGFEEAAKAMLAKAREDAKRGDRNGMENSLHAAEEYAKKGEIVISAQDEEEIRAELKSE